MSDYYVGEIRMLALPNGRPPNDWHLCDGTLLKIRDYQMLFALIGTTYGGDGTTTFAVPDMRGRLPVGQGSGTGMTARILGQQFGSETAQVSTDNIPAHNHTFSTLATDATTSTVANGVGFANTASPTVQYIKDGLGSAGGTTIQLAATVTSVGSNQGHDNVMPCATLNYVICCQGLFPTHDN